MPKEDPRIDTYINNAADFAKPILLHIRKLVHTGCPGVEETMKWSFPHFVCKGILCGMAAFKAHVALNFWKGALIFEKDNSRESGEAMGQFGRISSLNDLPSDKVMLRYIREAVRLNEEGVKLSAREKRRNPLSKFQTTRRRTSQKKKAFATFAAIQSQPTSAIHRLITERNAKTPRQRASATSLA
jgi:hypothetical protein